MFKLIRSLEHSHEYYEIELVICHLYQSILRNQSPPKFISSSLESFSFILEVILLRLYFSTFWFVRFWASRLFLIFCCSFTFYNLLFNEFFSIFICIRKNKFKLWIILYIYIVFLFAYINFSINIKIIILYI